MSETIKDGGLETMTPVEQRVFEFDWDQLGNLAPGVSITTSAIVLTQESGDAVLVADSVSTGLGIQPDARHTKVRITVSAGTRGQYWVANQIVTNETPAQKKDKGFRLRIESPRRG